MLESQLNIFLNDAALSDIDAQMLRNSEDLRLKQKQSSAEIEKIHGQYHQEESMVRNEMRETEKVSDEYKELMSELEELQEEEDRLVSAQESQAKDYEEYIEIQNSSLETRREAIKADQEATKEYVKEDTEKSFGYFK